MGTCGVPLCKPLRGRSEVVRNVEQLDSIAEELVEVRS